MVESSLYKKGLQKTRFIYNPSVQPEKTTAYNGGLFVCQPVRDPYKFNIFHNGNSCKEILD